jgi:DNA-binding NarL/FixJ family response regulator
MSPLLRDQLTPRQMQFVELLATGMPHKHIADQLGVSYRGVRRCLTRIYAKTGISGQVELACRHVREELSK